MTTSLDQETSRSVDSIFQTRVRAAVWQIIPDIIGEAVGAIVSDGSVTNVALTQPMIDKRHAWAVDFTRQPDYWVPKVAAMLAGENAIRAVDPPVTTTSPTDTVIIVRVRALIHALAGVKAVEV